MVATDTRGQSQTIRRGGGPRRSDFRLDAHRVFAKISGGLMKEGTSQMNDLTTNTSNLDQIFHRIKVVLTQARAQAWQAVNTAMVSSYWEIGRIIVEEEQKGQSRAEYGKRLLDVLSERLTSEFGKGVDRTNVAKMRSFYLSYPIVDALRLQLSWTHYRLLLRVEKPEARAFYEAETVNAR